MENYSAVYIDESGDTGAASQFIVFGVVATSSARPLEKLVKKAWKASPLPGTHGELHAHSSGHAVVRKLLGELSQLDVDTFYCALNKSQCKQPVEHEYYIELARVAGLLMGPTGQIVVDRKDTNRKREQTITSLKLTKAFKGVEFAESHAVKPLQAADFVAWAVGRSLESGDDSFVKLLPNLTRL